MGCSGSTHVKRDNDGDNLGHERDGLLREPPEEQLRCGRLRFTCEATTIISFWTDSTRPTHLRVLFDRLERAENALRERQEKEAELRVGEASGVWWPSSMAMDRESTEEDDPPPAYADGSTVGGGGGMGAYASAAIDDNGAQVLASGSLVPDLGLEKMFAGWPSGLFDEKSGLAGE